MKEAYLNSTVSSGQQEIPGSGVVTELVLAGNKVREHLEALLTGFETKK
jgi:hypothetical protein